MDLTTLRVADARRLVADAKAADITNPDLPHLKAIELITRLTTQLWVLSEHSMQQQAAIGRLQGELREARDEASRLWVENATRSAEADMQEPAAA